MSTGNADDENAGVENSDADNRHADNSDADNQEHKLRDSELSEFSGFPGAEHHDYPDMFKAGWNDTAPHPDWDLQSDLADDRFDAFAGAKPPPEPVDPLDVRRQHVTAVVVVHGDRWLAETAVALRQSNRAPDRLVVVNTSPTDTTDRESTEILDHRSAPELHMGPETAADLGASPEEPGPVLNAGRRGRASVADGPVTTEALNQFGADIIVDLPASTGYGQAVEAGLAAARQFGPGVQGSDHEAWIWLLHDDSAPMPNALRALLECGVRHEAAAIIGPKVVGWLRTDHILEAGISVTLAGRRFTGLERSEIDQGQHDEVEAVLAVGSPGLLIRSVVWDELGGFDPTLDLYRDDLDLGWRANSAGHDVLVCPQAVVRHAEAAARGRRSVGISRRSSHFLDRRNSLFVVLANAWAPVLPWVVIRALISGLARALVLFLGKAPAAGLDELRALFDLAVHPRRLWRARRSRAAHRSVSARKVQRLLPPLARQVRVGAENLVGNLGGGRHAARDVPDVQIAEDGSEVDVPSIGGGLLLTLLRRPGFALVAALGLLALFASRSLWGFGAGPLAGGALLPSPDSASALVSTYLQSWHPIGVGSATPAPPSLAILGVLGLPLSNSASAVVTCLLLFVVPLACTSAWFSAGKLIGRPWLRVWAVATWGLLAATTGAAAAGRLGTVVAILLLPILARLLQLALGTPAEPGEVRFAWVASLVLAVISAFVPSLWLAAVALGVVALVTVRRRSWALRIGIVLVTVPLLLAPWSGYVLANPSLLGTEAGLPGPGLATPDLAAWKLVLLHPGGPGVAPWWLLAVIPLAAVAALLSRTRRTALLVCWVVAGTGLVLAMALLRTPITVPTLEGTLAAWPGPGIVLAAFGLIAAAALGADRAADSLARSAFTWRQAVVGGLVVGALVAPIASASWWVFRGVDDPLERTTVSVIPEYMAQDATSALHTRVLVLRSSTEAATIDQPSSGQSGDAAANAEATQTVITYTLLRDDGLTLGEAETGPAAAAYEHLDSVVGDLLAGTGGDELANLRTYAVRYLYVPAPAAPDLVARLDGQPGLTRTSAPLGGAIWRMDEPSARVSLRTGSPGNNGDTEEPDVELVPSEPVTVSVTLPPATVERTLVLAESSDTAWRATLGETALEPVTVDSWAQGFTIPAQLAGALVVEHRDPWRTAWLTFQGLALLIVVALAAPSVRTDPSIVDDLTAADPMTDDAEPDVP